ncbi:orotidine 5'-phosphate decarboxylase [Candidatus Woesearchaeota archaeon]|nr:orotidine 5'-phosphate decarboxylase [Candidatus Woesearchaeota archaeon]
MIKYDKSIIPACDVGTLEELKNIVKGTCSVEGVGAYKIGFELVIPFGMKKVVEKIREFTELPIIYDHQKAGTDVPFTGEKFARVCKQAGVDAVILFPQAGPETETAWIKACQEEGLKVIVGGEMTHPAYLMPEGFLSEDAPKRIYELAASLGVIDFVVPGNKPEKILEYKKLLEEKGIHPIFYSPGLISQGGEITESAKSAGDNWHAIIGRGLYKAENIKKAAEEFTSRIK